MRIQNYVVVDLEMTGLNVKEDAIIEIGAVKVKGSEVVDTYACLVNAKRHVPDRVTELTGITDEMLVEGRDMEEALEELFLFMEDLPMVGHNVTFDYSFLKQWAVNHKINLQVDGIDTLKLARRLLPGDQSKTLEDLGKHYGLIHDNAHRALDDAKVTGQLFEVFMDELEKQGQSVEAKPLCVKLKKQTPASPRQIEQLKRLIQDNKDQLEGKVEIEWEHLTRSQASRLYDTLRCMAYKERGKEKGNGEIGK